jgi:hypothetical protein
VDIGQIIRDRAAANGVDPAILARIAQVESGGNPNAAATGSSAKGLFQFTDPTFARYAPAGADPMDPTVNADAGARLLKDNAAGLSAAGIQPSAGSLYLAHFAGLGGARKLMTADPATPAGDILGEGAVKANPFLAKMSVADLKNWAAGKMGGAAPTASPTQGATSSKPTGILDTPPEQPAEPQDDGSTDQALASLKALMAGQQQQEAPPPLQQIATPPPRRIDQAQLRQMLSTPLRRGFS